MSSSNETENDKQSTKRYLGDSVYAQFDGYGVILTTENGVPFDPSNKIWLEPEVLDALFKYAADHGVKLQTKGGGDDSQ